MQIPWFGIDGFDNMMLYWGGIFVALIIGFLLFVIFLVLYNVITSFIDRYSFFFKLKKLCAGKLLRCEKKHSLLRSFFNSYNGTDLVIYKDEKELYQIKFFPYFIRRKLNVLGTNETLAMRFRFLLWKNTSNWLAELDDYSFTTRRWIFSWFYIFTKYRKCRLDFDNESENRIILVPNKNIRISFFNTRVRQEVDNGVEYVNGSKFYDQKRILEKIKEHKNLPEKGGVCLD